MYYAICHILCSQPPQPQRYDYRMDPPHTRADWKYSSTVSGEQCVDITVRAMSVTPSTLTLLAENCLELGNKKTHCHTSVFILSDQQCKTGFCLSN